MEHRQERRALTVAALLLLFLVLGSVSTSKAEQHTYWYDDLNRLEALQIESAGKVMLFDYDEVGNRTAREVQDGYLIGVTAGVHGSVSTGTTVVPSGGSQTFNITPTAGYRIADVLIDGISVGPVTSYTFANTTASHTLVATFVPFSGTENGILWRNGATGENRIWYMDGAIFIAGTALLSLADQNWKVGGVGDFNGDGKTDVLWRNTATGQNTAWFLDGATFIGWADSVPLTDQNWKVGGVGDFNGDGKPDILWRNTSTGGNTVWFMNGVTFIGWADLPSLEDQNWRVGGVGDFNGDGKPDVLWRNTSTGGNTVWFMNGVTFIGWADLPSLEDQNWRVGGVGDFSGDGKPDVLWRNTVTGQNTAWFLDGATFIGWADFPAEVDQNWTVAGVGNFI